MLHWNSIVEGATAGVVAAVLIAIFAISRDTFRNMMLRMRIARVNSMPPLRGQLGWSYAITELVAK